MKYKPVSLKEIQIILHPYLFTSFASLSLLANNLTEIGLAGLRAITLSLIAALCTVLILRIILKDSLKAGLCASGAILLITSYGHVLDLAQNLFPNLSITGGSLITILVVTQPKSNVGGSHDVSAGIRPLFGSLGLY